MADIQRTIKDAVGPVADTATQLVQQARDTAGTVATAVGSKVSEAASYAGERADAATGAVAGGLKTAAQAIRDNVPDEGPLKTGAFGVAQGLSNSAAYLDQQGFNGMAEDVAGLIRKNPIPALLLGCGIGFLLGSLLRSRD